MMLVTYRIYDTDKGEFPPEFGEYNILNDDGSWTRALWASEWKEWFGPDQPHLWTTKEAFYVDCGAESE